MKHICTDRSFNRGTCYAPRPMSQSDRARLQPRDSSGRFIEYREKRQVSGSGNVRLFRGREPTESEISSRPLSRDAADLILVDESNSFSSKDDDVRRNLTIVCTRVHDVRRFEKTAELLPSKKGVRTKYSNSKNSDRVKILKDMASQDVNIVESHHQIDYEAVKAPEDKKKLYMRVISEAVGKALDIDPAKDADIVLDTPPVSIDKELRTFARHLEDTGRKVRWFETRRSASDKYLQVHDFATGTVSDHIEGMDEKDNYGIIRRRVREI